MAEFQRHRLYSNLITSYYQLPQSKRRSTKAIHKHEFVFNADCITQLLLSSNTRYGNQNFERNLGCHDMCGQGEMFGPITGILVAIFLP